MVDIYGSMELETREKRVMDFAQGRTRLFGHKKEPVRLRLQFPAFLSPGNLHGH